MDSTNEAASPAPLDIAGAVLGLTIGAFVGVLIAGIIVLIIRKKGKTSPMVAQVQRRTTWPLLVDLGIIGGFLGYVLMEPKASQAWYLDWKHILLILLIAATGWLAFASVDLLRDASVLTDVKTGRDARRFRTQAQVLRRFLQVGIVVLTLVVILLTFPEARAPMASLLASAGVVSVVLGLAAQSTLGNMFAGVQLAFTDALRVGDNIRLKDEIQPDTVEEITLTYVLVRTWDERRVLVPSSTFTSQPFENWTRRASKQVGYFELDLDWRAPIAELRAEVERLVFASPLWDRRNWVVQMSDLNGPYMTVRVIYSAENWAKLYDLRAYLRENVVAWINANAPWAIPRERIITGPETPRDQYISTESIYQDLLTEPLFTGPLGGGVMRVGQQMKILQNEGIDVTNPDDVHKIAKELQSPVPKIDQIPTLTDEQQQDLAKLVKHAESHQGGQKLTRKQIERLAQRIPGVEDPYDHPIPKQFKKLEKGAMLFSGSPEAEERAKMYDGPGDEVLAHREARGEMRRLQANEPLPPELAAQVPPVPERKERLMEPSPALAAQMARESNRKKAADQVKRKAAKVADAKSRASGQSAESPPVSDAPPSDTIPKADTVQEAKVKPAEELFEESTADLAWPRTAPSPENVPSPEEDETLQVDAAEAEEGDAQPDKSADLRTSPPVSTIGTSEDGVTATDAEDGDLEGPTDGVNGGVADSPTTDGVGSEDRG